MDKNFIDELNEYIVDSILEKDDEYFLSNLGKKGFPTLEEIESTENFIKQILEKEGIKSSKKDSSRD